MTYEEEMKKKLFKRRRILDNGCWEWTGACSGEGYGFLKDHGQNVKVSRLSMRLFKLEEFRKFPLVLHTCNNKKCFNPEHLYGGTVSDNSYDAHADKIFGWKLYWKKQREIGD